MVDLQLMTGLTAMFDIVDDASSLQLIREFFESKKVVGGVFHGSAAFLKATLSDGSSLIAGSEVTGFSNSEEDAVGLIPANAVSAGDRVR